MDFTEKELYEAFQLEAAEESTEPAGGEAGAAPEDSNAATQSEPAPDAQTTTEGPEAAGAPAPETAKAGAPEVKPEAPAAPAPASTPSEDAMYAAAFVGKTNPFTGRAIQTKQDYLEYVSAKERAETQDKRTAALERLKAAGIDAETLNLVLADNPMVKDIQRATELSKRIEQENHKAAIDRLIQADIAEIGKFDQSVKDVESLKKTPRGEAIQKRVDSGRYTYLEAWKLENFDASFQARTDAARQAAANAAASKEHLQSTAQRGSGDVDIPADVRQGYEVMGITDPKEQRESYRKYLTSLKKG